jgi:hypothetical protein
VAEDLGHSTGQNSDIRLDLPRPQSNVDQFQEPPRQIGFECFERVGLKQGNQELMEFENAFGVVNLSSSVELGQVILPRRFTGRSIFLIQRGDSGVVRVL